MEENPIPWQVLPTTQLSQYIDVLIEQGYKVAVQEQMEDPKEAKGSLSGKSYGVITPGTVVNSTKPR